jgi:DNA-binding beta-propeller fold protein YncE
MMLEKVKSDERPETVSVGSGAFAYEPVVAWERLPEGWDFHEAVGTATDSQDRVYIFTRGEHPVIVLDRDGNFLSAWGEDQFVQPHGICIGPDDMLYLSDVPDHTVRKYTPDGQLLLTLGASGQPGNSGIRDDDYRTIERPAPPFNRPTNLAVGPDGSLFVTDGYGNCCVHKFSPEGTLLFSWGEPGSGPGQFQVPHGIGIDSTGRVFIADRENSRLQLFKPDGRFLEEWTDVARPTEVFIDADDNIFVSELGFRIGMSPWMTPDPDRTGGRVSIFDCAGNLQARWGGGEDPSAPGDFFAPHDIWVDGQGSIYVSEVIMSAGRNQGIVPSDCPSVQKFIRDAQPGAHTL